MAGRWLAAAGVRPGSTTLNGPYATMTTWTHRSVAGTTSPPSKTSRRLTLNDAGAVVRAEELVVEPSGNLRRTSATGTDHFDVIATGDPASRGRPRATAA